MVLSSRAYFLATWPDGGFRWSFLKRVANNNKDKIHWELNFAQIRASDKFLYVEKFYPSTGKGSTRGTDLTISYLHFNKNTKLNDDVEVTGTLIVTMPRKNNPGHCQTHSLQLWCGFWQSPTIYLGNRRNGGFIDGLRRVMTGRFVSNMRQTSTGLFLVWS